ncbi:hypothetical protein FACS1894164_03910 [Spirochaetia bacterium]|nr:hypothetical protein FACS1894164_03910 [Spirochaetia bacterium]
MRTPKIYLKTTMFNFPFANDSPQYKADTLRLFDEVKAGRFEPFTSEYVLRELEDTRDTEKLEKMKSFMTDHRVKVLPASAETKRLADVYVAEGVIPERFSTDALHIAVVMVHSLDYIVSLNFQHIVKHKTIIETEIINTPAEVIDYDKDA